MPIKIPRYTSQIGIPDSVPYGQASGAAWAAPYAAASGGLTDVSNTLGAIYKQYQQEAAKLQAAEASVLRENLIGTAKDGYAGDELELRGQGLEPEQYEAQGRAALQARMQGVMEQVQDPMTRALIGKELAQYQSSESVKLRTQAFKMRVERTQAITGTLLDRDANEAITSLDPDKQQEAYRRGLGRIQELVATGVYSGEAGNAALMRFNEMIGEGTAAVAFRDPTRRGAVIAQLQAGRWPGINALKQQALAKSLTNDLDTLQKKDDAEAKKAWDQGYKTTVSDLYQRAVDKTLTDAEFRAATETWTLSREDQHAIREALTAPIKDQPSDPATLDRVIIGTHGLVPTMSDKELDALHAQKLLSTRDWKEAKDKANGTIRHNEERGQTLASQQQSQAEQMLRAELGISQMAVIENLDPVTKRAYARGMRELTARSNAFPGGKEPPLDVIKDIVPRLKTQIGAQAQETERELVQSLSPAYRPGPYTPDTGMAAIGGAMNRLAQDFSNGKISKGQRDIQVEYLARLHDIVKQRLARRIEDAEKGTQPARATAAPKPAGRGNVPAARPD